MMRKSLLGSAMMLALLCAACDDGNQNSHWQFQNDSSYRVYVYPNGQGWAPATIGPGSSVEVDESTDHSIQYVYVPSDKVTPIHEDHGTVTFVNR